MVNKFIYHFKEPQRGDIVVLEPPEILNSNEDYIKRVIGLPGDTVEMKEGKVFINGKLSQNHIWQNLLITSMVRYKYLKTV